MDELGLSNAEIAPEFGVAPNKVWQMKNGSRGVRPDEALIWSRLLRVHPSHVFQRLGYVWPDLTVPVVGVLKASGRVRRVEPGTATAVSPVDKLANLQAVLVESTMPGTGVHAGSHLYFEPYETVHLSAHGRLNILGLGDHEEPIIGTLESAALGNARIVVWGTGEVVHTDQTISAAPIRWVRAG